MPAALALARLLRITPREALSLLAQPRVLPAELDAATADSTSAALRLQGVEAIAIEVPPTASRCADHPSLTGEAPCKECRTLVCPLCLPLCRSCSVRRATAVRRKNARVGVLFIVFLVLAAVALLKQRKLGQRNTWQRPVRVSLVLVSPRPVEEKIFAAWRTGLLELDDWFASEAERVGLRLQRPVHFELAPMAVLADAPKPPPRTGDFLEDSEEAIKLRATLSALASRGEASSVSDVQLIIALRPAVDGAHWVEGLGESPGTIGLVEGSAVDTTITLELVAVAHELLHCLGADDGYDENGHALPRGVVEPERGLPQRFADVMVGEVPLGVDEGRIPSSLLEVRIGEFTAREIGWAAQRR